MNEWTKLWIQTFLDREKTSNLIPSPPPKFGSPGNEAKRTSWPIQLFMGKFTFHSELQNSWINSHSILSCKSYEQRPTNKLMANSHSIPSCRTYGQIPFHSKFQKCMSNPKLYEVQCTCSRHYCSHCALHVLHLEFIESVSSNSTECKAMNQEANLAKNIFKLEL